MWGFDLEFRRGKVELVREYFEVEKLKFGRGNEKFSEFPDVDIEVEGGLNLQVTVKITQ